MPNRPLSRFVGLALAGLVLMLACLPVRGAEAGRPNVVVILIDDLGQRDLGCYGSTFYRTPHLDRLAREGTRFTYAYAACPVCSPTRAAILTGKYPARLHLTDWLPGRTDRPDQKLLRPVIQQQLALEELTIAEALKPAGYVCGHIGKWHLGGEGFEPQRQGFDLNIAGTQDGAPSRYFAPFKDRRGRFMPGLDQAPDGEYLTDRLTDEAVKFIRSNRERPWFLYLAHYAVHIPLESRPELAARYKGDDRVGVQNNAIYAGMIESVDEGVGRILKTLEELQLSERTLVIFTSDNGGLSVREGPNTPATINAPLREGKGYLYEGGTRVPLIVKGPNVRAGQTSAVPACSIDLFPTILETCGVALPGKVDGVSLMSVLRSGTPPNREALYWHYPHYSNQGGRPGGSVRAGDYKLIEFYEQGRRELFNLKTDASESRNLVEQRPEIVRELADKLERWRRDVGAQTMAANPAYVPNPQAADGTVTLPARTADVHGVQLRYEPLPHKNTLGFWSRPEDWASWDFEIQRPGKFSLEVLQGCGRGQGGSEVEVTVAGQTIKMTVEDTGGFQNFKARELGSVMLQKAGRYTLSVKPVSKRAGAVMDLREVKLKPASETGGSLPPLAKKEE